MSSNIVNGNLIVGGVSTSAFSINGVPQTRVDGKWVPQRLYFDGVRFDVEHAGTRVSSKGDQRLTIQLPGSGKIILGPLYDDHDGTYSNVKIRVTQRRVLVNDVCVFGPGATPSNPPEHAAASSHIPPSPLAPTLVPPGTTDPQETIALRNLNGSSSLLQNVLLGQQVSEALRGRQANTPEMLTTLVLELCRKRHPDYGAALIQNCVEPDKWHRALNLCFKDVVSGDPRLGGYYRAMWTYLSAMAAGTQFVVMNGPSEDARQTPLFSDLKACDL